jgi:hypothetical protein
VHISIRRKQLHIDKLESTYLKHKGKKKKKKNEIRAMKARVLETAPEDLSRLLAASNMIGKSTRSKVVVTGGGVITKGTQGA